MPHSAPQLAPARPRDVVADRMTGARALLAQARTAGDAKRVADLARAAEVYAQRQKLGDELIADATALKVEAMTVLGEFLQAAEKRGPEHSRGGGSKGSHREPLPEAPPTLAESGISKKESMNAQALATVKDELPEVYEQILAGKRPVTAARAALKKPAGSKRSGKKKQKPDPAPAANADAAWSDFRARLAEVVASSLALSPKSPPEGVRKWEIYQLLQEASQKIMAAATRFAPSRS